jgi:hypothetical protein
MVSKIYDFAINLNTHFKKSITDNFDENEAERILNKNWNLITLQSMPVGLISQR